MNDVYDFGLIVQKLRKEKGMTQSQLARKLHKEASIVSRYENNLQTPTFETVRRLSLIFNVSMDYLSGIERNYPISSEGLNENQIKLIRSLCDEFRRKNDIMTKNPTGKQYEILGKILAELIK